MIDLVSFLLLLGLITGELFRPQLIIPTGLTLLDVIIVTLDLIGLAALKLRLHRPPPWVSSLLFTISIFSITLIMTPLNLTPWEYFISASYMLRILVYSLFGWIIYSGAFKPFAKMIPSIFTLSGVALAILGLLQFIFIPDISFLSSAGWDPHFYRTVSTFLDPNFLGIFLVLSMMSLTLPPKPIGGRIVYFLFFVIIYLALMTTFSRSAYLMFLATFLSLALLKKSLKRIILTISLSLGLILALTVYQITIAKPHNIDRQQSAEYRLGSWEMGIKLFKSAPVFGVGYNSYKYALRQYQLAPEVIFQGHGGSSNDSSLLFVAATTGIVGLTAYLTFLGILIFVSFKNYLNGNQNAGIACLSGLTGLIICSFFVNALFYPWSLVWLMLTASQLKETA